MKKWNPYSFIEAPTVGVIFLGRLRGGFDPEWGARVREDVKRAFDELPYRAIVPSDNIATDRDLQDAIAVCRREGCSVLVICQTTISDGRLASVLLREWGSPFVLWATPEKPEGSMISANSLVGTHVFAATMRQLHRRFELVYGAPDDTEVRQQLTEAIGQAYASVRLASAKVGLIGYHAPGFVDLHADPVSLRDHLGANLHHHSSPELIGRVTGKHGERELAGEVESIEALGLPDETGSDDAMEMQARYALAFRSFFAEESLDALAFRCWPDLPSNLGHWPYLTLARLVTGGVPIAMEGDVDGALASLAAECMGIGPVYLTDWLEHDRSRIVIWHTGAAPFDFCEPAGKPGAPRLGVQFNNRLPTVVDATIRAGMDVSLFRMWRCDGRYRMTALEGRTVAPEQDRMATNGVFETDTVDVRQWFDERLHDGMPHHVCVIPGHHAERLRRFARLHEIEWRG